MLGVIVNTLTVLVGSSIGLLAKKIIPKDWSSFIICGMGLCTMYIGGSKHFGSGGIYGRRGGYRSFHRYR